MSCPECAAKDSLLREWKAKSAACERHCAALEAEVQRLRNPPLPFNPQHLVRPTDPGTSVEAAHRAEHLVRYHNAIILMALREHPRGLTSQEIARCTPLTHPQVWRRMGKLRDEGHVTHADEARLNVSGRPATVWTLAEGDSPRSSP